jgi:hypothetical protein
MKSIGFLFLLVPAALLSLGCSRSSPIDSWPGWSATAADNQTVSNVRQYGLVLEEERDRVEGRGRKLVYRAEADFLVEDLSSAGQELETILKMHKGVVANSEVNSFSGAPRAGLWRVRVPADEFDAFLEALAALGELQRSKQDIQDVTRNHSELEEQIKNMTSEAEGLRELLRKPADKLADTLAVREQLAKVTRDMEGLKARLKRMQSEAEYSTVIVRLRERKGYVPDAAPTFATSISRAFSDSWQTLISSGKAIVLLLTMLVPWVPVLGFVVVLTWLLLRRRGRRPLAMPAVGA